jgi:hypothetical protein
MPLVEYAKRNKKMNSRNPQTPSYKFIYFIYFFLSILGFIGSKKKKNRGHERPQSAAPVVTAATGGRNERNKRPRPQGGNSGSCPVHPNSQHSASECREIIKLAKRVSERREQASRDGSPPHRRPGKEKVDEGETAAGNRTSGISHLSGSSRTSSLETLTPVTTTTAGRSGT